MPVTGVNHVNIRTTDVEASARFYVDLLDFELRKGPLVMGRQPNWLYDGSGNPIIHFLSKEAESDSTGPIDHIALTCQGKADIIARLQRLGIEHRIAENIAPGVTLIVLKDPHGISLELNFTGD